MAMGPFAVQDLAGIDIAMSSRHVFAALDRPGARTPRVMQAHYQQGRLGQTTAPAVPLRRQTNASTRSRGRCDPGAGCPRGRYRPASDLRHEIVERTIYALINEGARLLGEGYALRASDIDPVYINGYGFLAYRGGPMQYADEVGLPRCTNGYSNSAPFTDQLGTDSLLARC